MILFSLFCVVLKLEFGFAMPEDVSLKESSPQNEDSNCSGPNEYYDCGGACDNVCETLRTMNQTSCPIINIKCNEMCYCEEGYARDANNICVPFEECNLSPVQECKRQDTSLKTEDPSCGVNEEYKTCTCPPDTCMSLVAKFKCGPCEPGCACTAGYLRLTEDAPCRPTQECPQLANESDVATPEEDRLKESGPQNEDINCSGPNEYYDCGGACDNVCETLHMMNQTSCPIINIKCNDMCYCEEGYARDSNKICVPFEECGPSPVQQDRKRKDTSLETEDPRCGVNEEYKTCTCPPDTCISLVAKFKCGSCVPGCACRAGYLRLKKDKPCRPTRECPQLAHSPDIN